MKAVLGVKKEDKLMPDDHSVRLAKQAVNQGYMSRAELKDSRARMRDALHPAANDPLRSGGLGLDDAACNSVPTPAASYMDALAQVNLELEHLREAHDLLRTSLSPFLRVLASTPMYDEPMPPETVDSDASLAIYGIVRQVRAATDDIANIIDRFRP